MGIEEAIKGLEKSNEGLKLILDDVEETVAGLRLEPKFEGLVDDLENLFYAYLKTWIKSNTEILDILKKESK